MSTAQRIAVNRPDWMESHSFRRALAHPRCPLQGLEPDDLEQTMCDAMQDDEKHALPRADEETFRLHVAFMSAHGAPQGEYTTFTNGVMTLARGED